MTLLMPKPEPAIMSRRNELIARLGAIALEARVHDASHAEARAGDYVAAQ